MQICKAHWIQCRDVYEAKNQLLTVNFLALTIILEFDQCLVDTRSPYELQEKVEREANGCPLCYFRQKVGTEMFQEIDKRLGIQ